MWAIPLKNIYSQTITQEFSNVLSSPKRSPLKIESDRGAEFYNSVSQNLSKSKNLQHYSRFTDKGPSIAERVLRTLRMLIKKPVFEKSKVSWIDEIQSVIKKYNISYHKSIKMTPIRATKKIK